eukprot:scaffold15634_cov33-Prasinocladus_malaysianus.AAC.3
MIRQQQEHDIQITSGDIMPIGQQTHAKPYFRICKEVRSIGFKRSFHGEMLQHCANQICQINHTLSRISAATAGGYKCKSQVTTPKLDFGCDAQSCCPAGGSKLGTSSSRLISAANASGPTTGAEDMPRPTRPAAGAAAAVGVGAAPTAEAATYCDGHGVHMKQTSAG